jgi:hypothetical protein
MFKLIEFFKKRPCDKTIRIWRITFWLIILFLLWIYFNDYDLGLPAEIKEYEFYFKCFILIFGIFPILSWLINFCLAKMKYVRILQIIVWIFLIILWNNLEIKTQEKPADQMQTNSWSTDFESIIKTEETKKPLNVWFFIALIWIIPIIIWISWKGITSKCLKHWEIITKIRI